MHVIPLHRLSVASIPWFVNLQRDNKVSSRGQLIHEEITKLTIVVR